MKPGSGDSICASTFSGPCRILGLATAGSPTNRGEDRISNLGKKDGLSDTHWQHREEPLQLFIENVQDYAVFMLNPEGYIATWNAGAQRIKGYQPSEIIGQHFSRFYPEDDVRSGYPLKLLEVAKEEGRVEAEGWRVRKMVQSFGHA